jgi:hypothetical protein
MPKTTAKKAIIMIYTAFMDFLLLVCAVYLLLAVYLKKLKLIQTIH